MQQAFIGTARAALLVTLAATTGVVSAAAQSNVTAFGLPHASLGAATLTPNAQTGALEISGLGSTGNDGVTVTLMQAQSARLDLSGLSGVSTPAQIRFEQHSTQLDCIDMFDFLTFTNTWRISTDYSPQGDAGYDIVLLDGAQVVAVIGAANSTAIEVAAPPEWLAFGPSNGGGGAPKDSYSQGPCPPGTKPLWYCAHAGFTCASSADINAVIPCCIAHGGFPSQTCVLFGTSIGWSSSQNVTVGAVTLSATSVVFADPTPNSSEFTGVTITASNLSSFALSAEGVGLGFARISALGAATLAPTVISTQIANIGSSGQDGVRIAFNPSGSWKEDLWDIAIAPELGQPGAQMSVSTRGRVNALDDQLMASTIANGTSGGAWVQADFSSIGSPATLVTMFDASGAALGSFSTANNTPIPVGTYALMFPLVPRAVGFRSEPQQDVVVWTWTYPVMSADPSGTMPFMNVTRIEFASINATAMREHITSAEIRAANLPAMDLHGPALGPVAGAMPTTYCTAGTTTAGCVASIAADAQPSASNATPCMLSVSNVEGLQNGLFFYGLTQNASTWCAAGSSFLCVKAPLERTGVMNSGGNSGQCNGAFALDWTSYSQAHANSLGQPWTVGEKVYVQAWFRDPPACKGTSLSNALELTFQ